MIVRTIALFVISLLVMNSYGQSRDPFVHDGAVKGVLMDSVHNHVLQSATVAVYMAADTSLIGYSLTNNFGEFEYNGLPTGVPLTLVATHVGYKSLEHGFDIPSSTKSKDLAKLYLEMASNELEEVAVTIPPIQMNGDTLEFNADAFKLDPNAVVEDLLHQLPGVTVWGDGEITVNGRKVHTLLVDGKPFFGSDPKIATQNIPKNAIEKVQVYNSASTSNPVDSIMEVNLKLKKNKKYGYFGKVGGGVGTENKYERDGSISMFSPRTQISVVGSTNNNNKTVRDVEMLLRNASFKGVGANIELHPDFFQNGITEQHTAGLSLQHDFMESPSDLRKEGLVVDYFYQDEDLTKETDSRTTVALDGNENLDRFRNVDETRFDRSHRLNSRYDNENERRAFYVAPHITHRETGSHSLETSNAMVNSVESSSLLSETESYNSSNLLLEAGYDLKKVSGRARSLGVKIDYRFSAKESLRDRELDNEFRSSDSAIVQNETRLYDLELDSRHHEISLSLTNLKNIFFGTNNLPNISLAFNNKLYMNTDREDRQVKDFVSGGFILNESLSNQSDLNRIHAIPEFSIQRVFSKSLYNRYQKTFTVSIVPKAHLFSQKNRSDKAFQNFSASYAYFTPEVSVNYRNQQFNHYLKNFSLSYDSDIDFPTVDQLVPLVDNINIWYVRRGNPDLRPAIKRTISFNHYHFSHLANNIFNYNIAVNGGYVRDNMVDSSVYDEFGRVDHYTVNQDGGYFIRASGEFNKAVSIRNHTFQLQYNFLAGITKEPRYVNSDLKDMRNFYTSQNAILGYKFSNRLSATVNQKFDLFKSGEVGNENNQSFRNLQSSTGLSASWNATKRLTINSNFIARNTSSTYDRYTNFIWNASVIQRLLKGNNLEIKFSALDLLRQNQGIIQTGAGNYVTTGTVNVLPQYFLFSVAYYPRKFGRSD